MEVTPSQPRTDWSSSCCSTSVAMHDLSDVAVFLPTEDHRLDQHAEDLIELRQVHRVIQPWQPNCPSSTERRHLHPDAIAVTALSISWDGPQTPWFEASREGRMFIVFSARSWR